MATVNLISALRLLRQFGDSPEVVGIIQATLDELERLYQLEAVAVHLAETNQKDQLDKAAAQALLKMATRSP